MCLLGLFGLASATSSQQNGGGSGNGGSNIINDIEGAIDTDSEFYNKHSGIISLGPDLYNLTQDFSINGLADFACSAGREIDAGSSGGTGTVCEVAAGIDRLETILADANTTVLSKADTIFGDLASSGYLRVSNGDQKGVSELLTRFENVLNEVEDVNALTNEKGEPIGKLEALWRRGKAVVNVSRDIAVQDAVDKNSFNPGAIADSVYSIEERSKIQEYGIKSKVTQAASEDLSDASLQFTGETEQLSEDFAKLAGESQTKQISSVSTRATLTPLIDTLNGQLLANGMAQVEMHKQFNVLAEQGVYTVSQLSVLSESTLRQERARLEEQEAKENFEQRKSEASDEQFVSWASSIAGIMETAAKNSRGD